MAKNRKDAKLITNLTSTQKVIYYLKKNRCDSDVYINMKVDMTNAIKYIEKQKKNGKTFCTQRRVQGICSVCRCPQYTEDTAE